MMALHTEGYRMTRSLRRLLQLLALTLCALVAMIVGPQMAARAADRQPPSVRVSFSDLDLARQQGTATLYRRIRNAARAVCGPVDVSLAEDRLNWERCVDQSIANAVARVGNANLTAYYLANTHRGRAILAAQIAKRPGQH
jgi:UrcA family protein